MKVMLFTLLALLSLLRKLLLYAMLVDLHPFDLKMVNCGTSGTRVRESKLYRTEEEAKKVVEQHQNANKWR